MTGLSVPPGEQGVVRVFALDMPTERAQAIRDGGAADALGVDRLDLAHVDVFAVSDLQDIGLTGYLQEGAGIGRDRLAPDVARLKQVQGWVMVVRSSAFDGNGVTLKPAEGVDLVGSWPEPGVDWRSDGVIETASAHPDHSSAPTAPRQARDRSRKVGATVFAVVMLLLVAVIVLAVT